MLAYLKHMIQFMISGDEAHDKKNLELLADGIYERALQLYKTH
jgi:hypothetical protein